MTTEVAKQSVENANTLIIANMIEVGTETLCAINPDLIEVGNSNEAKEDLAEALGAAIFNNIIKAAGV